MANSFPLLDRIDDRAFHTLLDRSHHVLRQKDERPDDRGSSGGVIETIPCLSEAEGAARRRREEQACTLPAPVRTGTLEMLGNDQPTFMADPRVGERSVNDP